MIILNKALDSAITKATDDLVFQDALRRKFYMRDLLKQAEESLGKCYAKLTVARGLEREELGLQRLNIETHIEFLNRESVRNCFVVDEWMPRTSVETRKALNKLELDYNNNVFE